MLLLFDLQGPARYFVNRLGSSALALLGLATIVFAMLKVIPGDEAQVIAGEGASPEQVESVREQLGLDAPFTVQYVRYIARLIRGDLGASSTTHQAVASDIAAVLPATVQLVILSVVIAAAIAVPVATLAAVYRGSIWDTASRIMIVLLAGFPVFWLGIMGQWALGSQLGVLPISGQLSYGLEIPRRTGLTIVDALIAGDLYGASDALYHLALPAGVLAVPAAAVMFRTLRVELLAVLRREHILVAQAKGVPFERVLLSHALPNALGPLITVLGIEVGILIPSAILVETVFGLPGIGSYLSNAVSREDLSSVLGCVVVIGAIVVTANFLVDLVQLALDPRIRSPRVKQ